MADRCVIKIGGSLLRHPDTPLRLRKLINERFQNVPVYLVIGGGRVIDALRDLDQIHQLDPIAMHWRCICALDVTFSILCEWFPEAVVIDSPETFDLYQNTDQARVYAVSVQSYYRPSWPSHEIPCIEVPAAPLNWSTTTDTLAAILAKRLQTNRLVLLKSCALSTGLSLQSASKAGLVDEAFPEQAIGLNVEWIELHAPSRDRLA